MTRFEPLSVFICFVQVARWFLIGFSLISHWYLIGFHPRLRLPFWTGLCRTSPCQIMNVTTTNVLPGAIAASRCWSGVELLNLVMPVVNCDIAKAVKRLRNLDI